MTAKEWIETTKDVAETLGILLAATLALLRWGRPSWPGILIRNIVMIPPGSERGIDSKELTLAVEATIINPGPFSEVLTDLRLVVTDPRGLVYKFSPYIYAKANAFLEKDKTPEWVEEIFHSIQIAGMDEKAEQTQVTKSMVYFPDQGTPQFTPVIGIYTLEFVISRLAVLAWRRERKETLYLQMDEGMCETLRKFEKLGLVYFNLLSKRPLAREMKPSSSAW